MPGLCGIIGSPHDASASDRFSVMLQRMKHHHWYQVDAYQDISQGLALARISLGFVQTAPQPAWDADRTVCVVMDGELYGKPASNIEPSSINGHGRRETSDAELLLAGYLQEGADFFRKLNGTFAAAIWDSRIRRLVLTNDRFGMKPLYYARVPGKFLIASEIKSLLADPAVSRQPNPRGIAQFFSFGQLFCEDTLLAAVKVLPPGTWATYDQANDQFQMDRYWRLPDSKPDAARSREVFLERVDSAFARAVELRTNDSAALGISLSGGLDSRTILAVMDHQRVPIKSVSMGMPGSLDHHCADRLAELSNRDHYQVILDNQFLAHYEHFMRRMVHLTDGHYLDQCIVLPTLPKYAELGIQVLLRGHAGELLHMDKAYNFSLDAEGWAIRDEQSLRSWLQKHMRTYMLQGLTGPLLAQSTAAELQSLADESLEEALLESQGIEPSLHRVWHLFITQRLRRETAMSMAKIGTEFETRMPFLDNDVIDALLSGSPEWKRGDTIQSFILKKHRPEFLSVVNANTGTWMGAGNLRRKAATLRTRVLAKLGVPGYQPYERLGLWLRRELRPFVQDILLSPCTLDRGVFNPQTIRDVVNSHLDRRQNHTALILALLIFELGQREFIDGEGFAAPRVDENIRSPNRSVDSMSAKLKISPAVS